MRWLAGVLLLWATIAQAVDFDGSIYRRADIHLTQANLIPLATDLSATAATRVPGTPFDTLAFPDTGDATAIFQFTYPRNAVINRFEIEYEGHMSGSGSPADYACMRAAILVNPDGIELADNLGGTHVSGGDPTICCGDVGDTGTTTNGAVTACELTACTWYKDNGLSAPYPGGGGCVAHDAVGQACDCNGDGYVTGTEITLITNYNATSCPANPNYEGTAWQGKATQAQQAFQTMDAVRAYRKGAVTDSVCADGVATGNGNRATLCGGLPAVLVMQRLNTGCDGDLTGNFFLDTWHLKYYIE